MTPEDQTDPEWLAAHDKEREGSGVFLQLQGEDEAAKIIFAQKVNYFRCREIAEDYKYAAFKWVPKAIAIYATVKQSQCVVEGKKCEVTCVGLGCMCHTTRRVCVSDTSGRGEEFVEKPMVEFRAK